ncbi:TetR family transcriptional regulator [Aneurinibacillus migulanus]|uniref:TetR/AcrR family transcriptional regulator n=1 Tax=Aneurinibacillus migulanus TaxID=47500 RepID=UPI0005BBCEB1|nr:TetR/AcrR family transcriptional regulator [Aneurinibacillus migulanus]KIV53614.1 TetR family transcriptional regulator [Aneurinibacillus migulanus]KPD10039.1 TetR family transcriptional regulator [Aneurinibacillus migulanus]CEH30740.1 Transcriptional regulator, TetR family [Aneurinibacillus migulanus]
MEQRKSIPSMVKDPKLIEKRREQIIEAAVELFISKGFHKTTTREISRASGFSIGTLYEYIESKEDVLYLVCDAIHAGVEKGLQEVLVNGVSGAIMLEAAIEGFLRVMDQMQDRVLLIYQEIKSLPRETMRYVLAKEEEITGFFEEILHRGRRDGSLQIDENSVKLMAHNIVVLGEMWTFRRWSLRKDYTLEEFTKMQTSLILRELTDK